MSTFKFKSDVKIVCVQVQKILQKNSNAVGHISLVQFSMACHDKIRRLQGYGAYAEDFLFSLTLIHVDGKYIPFLRLNFERTPCMFMGLTGTQPKVKDS